MTKFHFTLLLLLGLFLVGCEEKERAFPEFGDANVATGAYARMTDGVNGLFNFFDPENSEIDFTVEFYDVNEGRDVASYSWTAIYINNQGGDDVGPVEVLTIPASSFTINDFGLPSTTVTFNLEETLDALNVPVDSINGGDEIRYEATITLNDGRTFTRNNTGANVISGASFRGTFILDQPIICPSDLSGTYSLMATVPTDFPDGPCAATSYTGESVWTENAEGVYNVTDLTFGAWTACYDGNTSGSPSSTPGGTLQLQDACNRLSFTGADSFGDSYTIDNLTVDGSVLTIEWSNTYGESGTAVITRTDDTDWPPLTN